MVHWALKKEGRARIGYIALAEFTGNAPAQMREAKLEGEMEVHEKDMDLIVQDQERLRENLKVLKGSAEEKALVQRYTQQLDKQETRLESLRKQIEETEARRDKANDELKKMIEDLQIETTL